MTPEDEVLRESLRNLIPGYRAAGDPFARVTVSVRRRRARRRILLALGSAASVALVAAAVPTLVGLVGPVAGHHSGASRDGGPRQTGPPPSPAKPARLYPVAHGRVDGARWSVGSIRFSDQARRCLYADDKVIFNRAAWCFDDWRPGQPVTWAVVNALRPGAAVTAVFGVASEPVRYLEVQFAGGPQRRVYTVATHTDPRARFFAVVLSAPGRQVQSMASFAADGTAVDTIVLQPAAGRPCAAVPDLLCASPPS